MNEAGTGNGIKAASGSDDRAAVLLTVARWQEKEASRLGRMPNAGLAYVEERKARAYLLALEHPDGHGKAAFFMRFGFRLEEWKRLAEALLEHARENRLVEREETPFGVQYAMEGPLRSPDGRAPPVPPVWEERPGERGPGLVTAYPGRRKR